MNVETTYEIKGDEFMQILMDLIEKRVGFRPTDVKVRTKWDGNVDRLEKITFSYVGEVPLAAPEQIKPKEDRALIVGQV